jgi:hypothetical protein
VRYDLLPLPDCLALFRIRRTVLSRVLASLTDKQWSRQVEEPGKLRKESVYWQARGLALHDLDHLDEIENRISSVDKH